MDTELLDLDLGPEPPLTAPVARLEAGRRALRRRRAARALAGSLGVVALASTTWALLPDPTSDADRSFAGDPSPTVVTTLPTVTPDDCLGDVCVELVPHGKEPLDARWGDMALGFRDGRLVRLSPDVEIVKAIVDPTGTGATQSAAVEVEFRDTRFRVAMAQEFGYVVDQLEASPSTTLAQWFAARHDLPDAGCAVQAPRDDAPRAELPGPGECWVRLDERGVVVPHAGVTLLRQMTPELAEGGLPPGVRATGVAFSRDGTDWFGVVRRIGDRAFVNTTLVRFADLSPGTTLEAWVAKTAPETSMTGVPDPDYRDQPEPWQTLHWWDPGTGDFQVPDGVSLVRHVENPLGYAAPDDSAGLVFDFRGKRYWALSQLHAAPPVEAGEGTDADDIRTGGVTVTRAQGERTDGGFEAWLATVVAEITSDTKGRP